jgi:energy-coupling factor transport system substrate-specific component
LEIRLKKSLIILFSFFIVTLPVFLVFFGLEVAITEWSLISSLIIIGAIVATAMEFSHQIPKTKEIALIIVLGTMVASLRVPFAVLPSIQPCTFLIICTGIIYGPNIGFLVGILTPLISNFFLGHGPWSPLQMYAWGLIGSTAGLIKFNPKINRWILGLLGILSGYLYGFIMNVWFWYTFLYPLTIYTFIIAEMQGIFFDTLHAIGNFAFLTILGVKTLEIFNNLNNKYGFKSKL